MRTERRKCITNIIPPFRLCSLTTHDQLTLIVGGICGLCFLTSAPKFRDDVFDGNLLKGMLYYAKVRPSEEPKAGAKR